MRPAFARWALAMIALAAAMPAHAQSPACRQITAELQALGRGGGQAMQQAASLRRQHGETLRAMAGMGCQGGLFGAPAQCQPLRQQAAMLAGQINQIEGLQRGSGSDTRRRQLEDAYAAQDCSGAGQINQVRAIFETEAGRSRYATPTLPDQRMRQLEDAGRATQQPGEQLAVEARERRGGTIPICVRTCDGFFFPVNYQGAEGQYSDVCRASCPGASAEMYWMAQGGDLDSAVSPRGQRYSALPAAFRYRQTHDAACSCKSSGAGWGQTLARAESLIRRKGDIIVTAETSARLANPDLPPDRILRGLRTDPEATASIGIASDKADGFQPLPAAGD